MPKFPKFDKSKKTIEPNAMKRAQQNVIDGKGMTFLSKKKRGNGDFLFASANPMWKSALDTLSFMSLSSVDYSGGILITDWYSEDNPDEAIKINVRFLTNTIRADGIIVSLYKRNCVNSVCSTREIEDELIYEIKDKILRKAVIYKTQDDKSAFENRPKKAYRPD
tara:strand:- start:653 stop:1147 length:495 start_codon:yes stop_codon:yes gene_type:complete